MHAARGFLSALRGVSPAASVLCRGLASVSSSAPSVADQCIAYASRQCKGKNDEALDILRTGLNAPGTSGFDSARLHLACGEKHLDADNISDVLTSMSELKSALRGVHVPPAERILLQSSMLSVRALLLKGDDDSACKEAVAAAGHESDGNVSAISKSLLLTSAQVMDNNTGFGGLIDAAESDVQSAVEAADSNLWVGDTAQLNFSLAGWKLTSGDLNAAKAYFSKAADAAAKAQHAAASETAPIISEFAWSELEADALLGSAQIAISNEQWEEAESLLGLALKAAEAVSSEGHPRVAAVLLLLGKVYSRTGRVMFAEGLYRESIKLLRLDAARPQAVKAHPSLAAMLAWSYHQLMVALPNRGADAAAWEKCARALWSSASAASRGRNIADVLGAPERLKGHGDAGSGAFVVLQIRRAFTPLKPM